MPDIASNKRMPIGGFATSSSTVCPAMIIVPPTGTSPNVTKAGTSTRKGASLKTVLSASVGMRSSFSINLRPSASVWSSPKGPQRCGPMRLCMSEINLRSNQIIKITEVINSEKAMNTFKITITHTANVTPWANSGSAEASQFISCPIEPG